MLQAFMTCLVTLPAFAEGESPKVNEDTWKEKLIREAPKAWSEYYTRAKGLQGTWSIKTRINRRPPELIQQHFQIKQTSDCALVLEETDEPHYLSVKNPKYSFSLQRARNTRAWIVDDVRKGALSGIDDPSHKVGMINRMPYTFSSIVYTLQVTVVDPGFSVTKVYPVVKGDRQLVMVHFKYSPPDNPVSKPLRGGSVLFDPEQYWTIKSFDTRSQWGGNPASESAEFEYNHAADGFPILKKIVLRSTMRSRPNVESTREFCLAETRVSPREFRLSYYGLPEPQSVVWNDRSYWYLWFIAVAVLSLAVGWYFRRRVQRRKMLLADNGGKS